MELYFIFILFQHITLRLGNWTIFRLSFQWCWLILISEIVSKVRKTIRPNFLCMPNYGLVKGIPHRQYCNMTNNNYSGYNYGILILSLLLIGINNLMKHCSNLQCVAASAYWDVRTSMCWLCVKSACMDSSLYKRQLAVQMWDVL